MDKRELRRMAWYVKLAEPRINTQRTKFICVEQPEVPIAMPPTKYVIGIDEPAYPFRYETIRLETFAWWNKHILYRLRWAYHEKSDTVFYRNWQKYVKASWGEWLLISTLN